MLGKSALSDFCSLDVVYLLSGAPKLIGNFNSRLTIGQKRASSPARTDLGGSDTIVAIPYMTPRSCTEWRLLGRYGQEQRELSDTG